MDNRQQRTLQAFQNILIYLDQHPVTPEPPLLAGKRKQLRASITRIQSFGSDQRKAQWDARGNVEQRRQNLRRRQMMPLVRIARPLLKFAPGIEAELRVPHARADAKTVADTALRIADAIAPHAKIMRSAGYSKSFLSGFRHEARQLALVARNSDRARERRSTATGAMAAEFKKAMDTVTIIEGLVMLHLAKDKHALKHWKNRRRVPGRIGRPRQRRSGGSDGHIM